ncbi:MAG: DEAD/DEAH box helicase, partial [Acidimicrobiales bacterium]
MEGRRVFARRGPFEKSDRVGHLFRSESLISTFSDLGVPAAYNEVLSRQGITEPLTIQTATIPAALQRRDICGKAPTGSGKTLAFGIPLVVNTERSLPRRPKSLVLVPTRELASQVHEVLGDLLGHERKRVVSIFGGTG